MGVHGIDGFSPMPEGQGPTDRAVARAKDTAARLEARADDPLANREDPEALRRTARELEGVFLGMMFEEMSKSVPTDESGLFPDGPGKQMFEQWFRTEVAKQWAEGGGVGLGNVIAGALTERGATGGRAIAPVRGDVTSGYGARTHPVTGESDFHHGVDIGVPTGTEVKSPFAGEVVRVDDHPHLGLRVEVEHAGGFRSVFAHLSGASVEVGGRVEAGQVLARSGSSGRATGPHLHYSLSRMGRPVDPSDYVELTVPKGAGRPR